MDLIIKIAWRNIWRHKGKSIIISLIIFLGILIMTLGNSVVSGMDKGIENNFINNFFGHMTLFSTNKQSDSLFENMGTMESYAIADYPAIKKVLNQQENIHEFLPVGFGYVMTFNETGQPDFAVLMGVNYPEYQRIFNSNAQLLEGHELAAEERGILVPYTRRRNAYRMMGFWLIPEGEKINLSNMTEDARTNIDIIPIKSNIVLMGIGTDSPRDIRVGVKGVIRYKNLDSILGDDIYVGDIESFRECMGYFSVQNEVQLSKEDDFLLTSGNFDNMSFDTVETSSYTKKDIFDLENLKTTTTADLSGYNLDEGSYNFVFIKIKDGLNIQKESQRLNTLFKEKNLDARVVPWDKAMGQVGTMTMVLRVVVVVFVLFLFFVAAIIIMNTLSMTALERTNEIGMMRAVGARKQFIARMFFFETIILSLFAGIIAITVGFTIVKIIPLFDITSTNEFAQLLFGGDKFTPYLSFADVIFSIFLLLAVTSISIIYPIRLAKKITPLEAISRD